MRFWNHWEFELILVICINVFFYVGTPSSRLMICINVHPLDCTALQMRSDWLKIRSRKQSMHFLIRKGRERSKVEFSQQDCTLFQQSLLTAAIKEATIYIMQPKLMRLDRGRPVIRSKSYSNRLIIYFFDPN